jgi:hypothetical protein
MHFFWLTPKFHKLSRTSHSPVRRPSVSQRYGFKALLNYAICCFS